MSTGFTVIEGGGEGAGPTLEQSQATAQQAVWTLVDGTGNVHYASVMHLDHVLRSTLGFQLVQNSTDACPAGGRQLFYLRDNVLVRIKTRGTERGPRQGVAHMTVSLIDRGIGWDNERAKFTAEGSITWKLLTPGGLPRYSWPTAVQDGLTTAQQDTWANDCHFNFPSGLDDSGAASLTPG